MAKKPELPKTLKRSKKKARKRFIKAFEKAMKKHGSKKRAYRKAYTALEKKYELVGKKWERKEKPQKKAGQKKAVGKSHHSSRVIEADTEGAVEGVELTGSEETFTAGEVLAPVRSIDSVTRAELYRKAQELKIAGRSGMNKAQLFIAVQDAEA